MNLILPDNNISELPTVKFPVNVERMARLSEFTDDLFEDRVEVNGFTIDDAASPDLDDAIQLKKTTSGWLAQVTISDVDSLVSQDSYVDLEALKRVCTQYYSETKRSGEIRKFSVPMIPRVLSENRLSLHAGKIRPTMTVEIELNEVGKIQKIAIIKSYLRSSRRMSHQEYEGTRIVGDPGLSMNTYLQFSKMLAANRWAEGSLAFQQLKQGISFDEEGMVKKGAVSAAFQIVQEFMILANRSIAIFFQENSLVAPFRIHSPSDGLAPTQQQIIEEVERTPDYLLLVDNLRSIYNKYLSGAIYSPRPDRHFGLGLPSYLHFTSPIRRYADLVNHRIAKAIIDEKEPPYSAEEMQRLCQYMNERNRRFLTLRSIKSGKHSFHTYQKSPVLHENSEQSNNQVDLNQLMSYLSEHRIGNPIFEFSIKPGIHIELTCKAAVRFHKQRHVAEVTSRSDKTTVKNTAARRLLKTIKSVHQNFLKTEKEFFPPKEKTKSAHSEIRKEKPVGQLFEYCSENNLPSPNFHYEIWGGGVMPITCHCQITAELAVSGHGANRIQSKHAAAQKLLQYLQTNPPISRNSYLP